MQNRKIILNLCTSFDSFIEGKNGEIDWCLTDQDYGMTEFLAGIDTILFGRKSYEQLLELMPDAFADKKWIVFSKTLNPDSNKHTIINNDPKEVIPELLKEKGENIWLYGGASLTSVMLNSNLIDEMIVSIHPVILGAGMPLFKDISSRKNLILVETQSYSSGLVQLRYKVLKNA